MTIRYYLTLFPMEALIASELTPEEFGSYMSTGSTRGTSEQLIFVEVKGELPKCFDLEYTKEKCANKSMVPGKEKKNSVYLSVYRTLEKIPLESLGELYLMTRDGRSLALKGEIVNGSVPFKPFYLYQELCPIRPLVVSKLEPCKFGKYMTDASNKTSVPKIAYADLKVIDFDHLDSAGNIGDLYYRNISHLKACLDSIMAYDYKKAKTLDRSRIESFTYQLLDLGIFICDPEKTLYYRMKSPKELQVENYAWARSANIL